MYTLDSSSHQLRILRIPWIAHHTNSSILCIPWIAHHTNSSILRIPWIAHHTNSSILRIPWIAHHTNSSILRIPWIAHHTNCSILNELYLPTNWLYNFVRRQKRKYFGHVTRHNGLEKTIMQGIITGDSQYKDGRKTSQKRLVRWQPQAAASKRRTGINFQTCQPQFTCLSNKK